jgi:hypothetical protein
MPHFYFHLQHGPAVVEDQAGSSLPDAEAAWYQADRYVRDFVTGEACAGSNCCGDMLQVVDERGGAVWTIPLHELTEIAA